MSVVSINDGSTVLVEAFCEYLGSGYRQKLNRYPCFDLRLFKRCLQRTASRVFGSLDRLAMTELLVYRLKGWDVLSPRSEESRLDQRLGYASSCGRCSQNHWCVAIDRLLFEGDVAQRLRR